jgi:hypothetical protein
MTIEWASLGKAALLPMAGVAVFAVTLFGSTMIDQWFSHGRKR